MSEKSIGEFLNDPVIPEEQKVIVKWQYHLYGGFMTALWQAITKADLFNLNLLEKGFPLEVHAYKKFTGIIPCEPSFAERIRRNGIPI